MLNLLAGDCMKPQKGIPKQNRPGELIRTVVINGREATSTKGAITILEGLTGHKYSRDAVYRMYIDGKIEGERTDLANFYYVDSLQSVAPTLTPSRGRKKEPGYPPEVREKAIQLKSRGKTTREIAQELGVTNQIVSYWTKKKTTEQS